MQARVIIFTYIFVAGVGISMLLKPGPEIVWPLYIAAAALGIPAWILTFMEQKGRFSKKWIVVTLLSLSAFSLGYARHAQRDYIPPFSETAESVHLKTFVAQFPDVLRDDRTRFVGTIVAEPEYRPAGPGKPGVIVLTVRPYEMQPDTDSKKSYKISEGNIAVALRPGRPFSGSDREFREAFEELALYDCYGYTIEVDAGVQGFRPAENPGLFDAENFNNDKEIFASSSIYFWNRTSTPIRIIERTKGNLFVEVALDAKTKILEIIKRTVPFPESAFLAGVTLGARRGLDGVRTPFEPPPPESDDPYEETREEIPDLRQLVLDQFRWSGTSHVLAVSGLHVTIITGALWGLFLSLRIPKKIYAPLVVLGLTIFCLITGAAPSSLRATIMNSLVILTYVYIGASFKASLILAIGVSGFVILMDNPKWLIQPSFALSFMAVLALGLLTPPIEAIMKKIPGMQKIHPWIAQFIYAQGAIQFGMMGPLSAYYFTRMSIAGPIANFLAIPLIGIIVQLGLFAGLLGMIPGIGIYLALILNAANYIMIWIFLWAAHISTVILPFPMVQTMTPRMLIAYYILLGLFAAHRPILRQAKILYYDLAMGIGGAKRRAQTIVLFSLAFVFIGVTATYGFWPREPAGMFRMNALAVRYGSAVHIETPTGAHILVDAGPNDYRGGWNTGERTIAQYLLKDRIGHLDAVIMTSASPEDMGGISAILKIFPTARFYSPIDFWNLPAADDPEFRDRLAEMVQNDAAESPRNSDFEDAVFHFGELRNAISAPMTPRRGLAMLLTSPLSLLSGFGLTTTPYKVAAGDVIWREDGPGGKFEIVALHPTPETKLSASNENSLVLRITYGATGFLLTGDITEEGITELSKLDPKLLAADVVFLPAHGSPRANIPEFHDLLFPKDNKDRYAVLSYGWNRGFKPPAGGFGTTRPTVRDSFLKHRQLFDRELEASVNATADAIHDRGVVVARTDQNGAILMRSDGTRVDVAAFSKELVKQEADAHEETERFREF